jgi:hypothetical protein
MFVLAVKASLSLKKRHCAHVLRVMAEKYQNDLSIHLFCFPDVVHGREENSVECILAFEIW